MDRESGGAESKWRGRVLGRYDFDFGIILDDGLDSIVQDAGDGYIHGFLFGHDVTGITVFNIAFKDAGRVRSVRGMRGVRGAGCLEVSVLPGSARLSYRQTRRGSATGSDGGGSAMLAGTSW